MCLIVFAYKVHPHYPLILAANRDEFYNRPAKTASFWNNHPDLLAGKDLKAGGTWMGITKSHRFAALTNFRDMKSIKKDAPSRGHIVTDFLTSTESAPEFFESIKDEAHKYNGFNLIYGMVDNLYYFNNQEIELQQIDPGCHTLSNAFLDTEWPKTDQALSDFKKVISADTPDRDKLFGLLQNTKRFPEHLLPSTGLDRERERLVSSVFILTDDYGTRCSTLLFANPGQNTTFIEKTYKPGTVEPVNTAEFNF